MWDGALVALGQAGPHHPRHVAVSVRALMFQVRNKYLPAGNTDREWLASFFESTGRRELADADGQTLNALIGRLSRLDKQPSGRSSDAAAAMLIAAGLLMLILDEED